MFDIPIKCNFLLLGIDAIILIFCKSEIPVIQAIDGLRLLKWRANEKAVGDLAVGRWPVFDFLGRHNFCGVGFL